MAVTKKTDIEKRASKTAMFAAVHRYLSLFESNPVFSSQDTLSGLFTSRLDKFLLGFSWVRHHVRQKLDKTVPGTYPYVIARTRCFDERFVGALQARVPQIVILGAGYDSTQTTLFLWEGVTYYLTESAVLETFAFIKNSAPRVVSCCLITFTNPLSMAGSMALVPRSFLILWQRQGSPSCLVLIRDG